MRLSSSGWLAGGLALGLGGLAGFAAAAAGGSIQRAPTAIFVMAAGLGGAALIIGTLVGLTKQPIRWAAFVLLGSFYLGTWLSSPHHSLVGDMLFLALAAVPTFVAITLGSGVGRYFAARRP